MSKFTRDPYIVAASGRADGFGRRGRRVGALALYLDVARMERESEAWEFVDAAFRELANRTLPPSKSRRPGNVRAAEQRKRWHRMLDVLMLRYVHGLSYEQIGVRLREPVSRERVRQMIAKGLRILRHPVRFQPFRATMAQELDETCNPFPANGEQFCGGERDDGAMCGLAAWHDGLCSEWKLARSAPGSTDGEALEARDVPGQPDSPVVEPGVERAEADAAALREALEDAEWRPVLDAVRPFEQCPKCRSIKGITYSGGGHGPKCGLAAALATDAGRALLDEVRALRECVSLLQEAYDAIDDDPKRSRPHAAWARDARAALDAVRGGKVERPLAKAIEPGIDRCTVQAPMTTWECGCGLALPCPYHDAPKVEESRTAPEESPQGTEQSR